MMTLFVSSLASLTHSRLEGREEEGREGGRGEEKRGGRGEEGREGRREEGREGKEREREGKESHATNVVQEEET